MRSNKSRTLFIVTGVAAWLGGLATAFAVSSCDVDTCEMNPDDPQCLPDPLDERVGEAAPDELKQPPGPPPACDYASHPSVHVSPVRRFDDYFTVVDVDTVWFEHEGQTHEALCLNNEEGCIGAWTAGYEMEGEIKVSTEYCDTVVTQTVDVGRTRDDCHVQTEFMLLEIDTRGCLVDQAPPAGPPMPPPEPWRLTTRPASR